MCEICVQVYLLALVLEAPNFAGSFNGAKRFNFTHYPKMNFDVLFIYLLYTSEQTTRNCPYKSIAIFSIEKFRIWELYAKLNTFTNTTQVLDGAAKYLTKHQSQYYLGWIFYLQTSLTNIAFLI